jgi:hypothetical protein
MAMSVSIVEVVVVETTTSVSTLEAVRVEIRSVVVK